MKTGTSVTVNKTTEEIHQSAVARNMNELAPEERPLAMRKRSNSVVQAPPLKENVKPETLNVLVVEDNLVNQRIIAKQLRKQGCIVHVANQGQEALDFLQTTVFWSEDDNDSVMPMPGQAVRLSIILMDLEMPVME